MDTELTQRFKIEKDILKLEILINEEIKSWPEITLTIALFGFGIKVTL